MPDRYRALSAVLNSLYQVLASLGHVMDVEQQQLMAATPDSRRLMSLSEDKQALLTTLGFVEQQRCESESALAVTPPILTSHHWLHCGSELRRWHSSLLNKISTPP